MRKNKIYAILLSMIFFLSLILSCFYLFTVRAVNIEYDVSEGFDTAVITDKLNSVSGKFLPTLDDEDIYGLLKEFPKLETLGIKKDYPNAVFISLKERKPLYYISDGAKKFVLDEKGFVMEVAENFDSDRLIALELVGVSASERELGKVLATDNDEILTAVYESVLSVEITDSVKTIKVFCEPEREDVIFCMRSGVDITITKAKQRSLEKVQKAFGEYEACQKDYQKLYSAIEVFEKDDGEIVAEWLAI